MRRLQYSRGRMIFESPLTRELSPFANHTGIRYSFPICPDILARIRKCYPNVELDQKLKNLLDEEEHIDNELNFRMNYEDKIQNFEDLLPHQRSGARWMSFRQKCILADEQGTGKTVTSLAAASLSGKKNLCIVCATAKFKDWQEHADKWFRVSDKTVQITTFKSFPKVDGYDILIIDEAHKLRNRKSETYFKPIRSAARKIDYVFMLTGTPNVNEAGDIWTLLDICDPKRFNSYWGFVYRFCLVMESAYGITVGGMNPGELEAYRKLIYGRYLIARRSTEVFDVSRITYEIPMTDEHKDLYSQYVKKTVSMTDVGILLKAAIDPSYADPADRCLYTKYDALTSLVNNTRYDSRYIIFVKHIEVAERIRSLLASEDFSCAAIHSQVNKKKVDKTIELFQEKKLDALVITFGIGGEGLNLTAANKMIIFEFPWTFAAMSQGEARFLRIGQKQKNLEIYTLYMKDTLEERVLEIIDNKQDLSLENLGISEI